MICEGDSGVVINIFAPERIAIGASGVKMHSLPDAAAAIASMFPTIRRDRWAIVIDHRINSLQDLKAGAGRHRHLLHLFIQRNSVLFVVGHYDHDAAPLIARRQHGYLDGSTECPDEQIVSFSFVGQLKFKVGTLFAKRP